MVKAHLLIIDPQEDFCNPNGALYVKNAEHDMTRLAAMIRRLGQKIDDIHVTLDQHHLVDVAHPAFWKDSSGKHPNPSTMISHKDVIDGVWSPVIASATRRMMDYTKALEDSGRYPLCVWPPHCLIGSQGAIVVPEVMDALNEWAAGGPAIVDFVSKGSNIWTEHYSAAKAEVPDPNDPTTQLNTRLVSTLEEADLILVAGEAGSHCLANTVRDIADAFSDESIIAKMVLLEDATSPVVIPGVIDFTQAQEDFVKELTAKGMQLSKTTEILV